MKKVFIIPKMQVIRIETAKMLAVSSRSYDMSGELYDDGNN